tara:strand:- start:347 stop:586 length:240 start_codon:yes stop_codon:yes gene_type:complete
MAVEDKTEESSRIRRVTAEEIDPSGSRPIHVLLYIRAKRLINEYHFSKDPKLQKWAQEIRRDTENMSDKQLRRKYFRNT